MTLHKAEQHESPMTIQTAALALATYTLQEVNKESVVAKRNHWTLGERLVNAALDIGVHLDMANIMRLDFPTEAAERLKHQDMALAAIYRLNMLVKIARDMSCFPEKKHMHWTRLSDDVRNMLVAWKESDRSRKRRKQC
ncbi:MAG: hypothetical protein IKR62_02790 [Victivallales bacterium]|nr:hypothetical protein [Victivallales bacterium]